MRRQKPAEPPEAKLAMLHWILAAGSALPKPTMQSETLEEPTATANPSVSQSLTNSAQVSGFPVPHRFGYAACRVEVTYPYHTSSITQHHYPFKSIYVLKKLEKLCD